MATTKKAVPEEVKENEAPEDMEVGVTADQREPVTAAGKPDTVVFRLFKDNDKYKDDVFVGVNGKSYLVKRGVDVEMPRAVYEVLINSQEQLEVASEVMNNAEYKEP